MFLKCLVLQLTLLNCALIHSVPVRYSHDASWNYDSWGHDKDHLKQWGLYPRIFRYGTSLDAPTMRAQEQQHLNEVHNHRRRHWKGSSEASWNRNQVGMDEFEERDKYDGQNKFRGRGKARKAAEVNYANKRKNAFRKLKDQRLRRMEQETAEVLWKW